MKKVYIIILLLCALCSTFIFYAKFNKGKFAVSDQAVINQISYQIPETISQSGLNSFFSI